MWRHVQSRRGGGGTRGMAVNTGSKRLIWERKDMSRKCLCTEEESVEPVCTMNTQLA